MTAIQSRVLQFIAAPLVMLMCLWGATQWAASMLGYQTALGAPWIDIFGLPLYPPWQLFNWWLAFDAQAPGVFNRAGAVAAFGGVLSGAVAMGGAAWRASQNEKVTTYGSARWADACDVTSAGLRATNGVILGLYDERYLRHDGPEHVMVVAPTRSGKGVGLVVPTLLSWTESAVIHDVKGENWELTAGWRARFSHCLLFDPTNPLSARFNPLMEVRKGPMEVRMPRTLPTFWSTPTARWSAATTGRKPPMPCSSARSCMCSTPKRTRRSPASRLSCLIRRGRSSAHSGSCRSPTT